MNEVLLKKKTQTTKQLNGNCQTTPSSEYAPVSCTVRMSLEMGYGRPGGADGSVTEPALSKGAGSAQGSMCKSKKGGTGIHKKHKELAFSCSSLELVKPNLS